MICIRVILLVQYSNANEHSKPNNKEKIIGDVNLIPIVFVDSKIRVFKNVNNNRSYILYEFLNKRILLFCRMLSCEFFMRIHYSGYILQQNHNRMLLISIIISSKINPFVRITISQTTCTNP